MDKRRVLKVPVAVLIVALASIIAYAIIQYYGQVQITVPVEQAVWVDGKRFNETITETLAPTYGGCTVYANHTLENRGDAEAKVKFALVSITDSKGTPVTDNTVSVTWLLEGNPIIQPLTIPAHATVNFTIAISFHYAIMPDTYTVTVQVEPYVP
jgi:uncharacterized membrane protein